MSKFLHSVIVCANDGLRIADRQAVLADRKYLTIEVGEELTADRTLTIEVGDADRTLTLPITGSGTVTTVSVVTANGFAGTVANDTTTPAITLTTSVTGILKGNGTAISAATADTDYATPAGVVSYVGSYAQPIDGDLTALAALASTGVIARTGSNTYALRTLTGPAAGISISNGDGVSGNPTLALANDLAALEGLSSTGIAVRTTTDTWAQRTLTGTADKITVTNGDGVSGNPTITVAATYAGQASIVTVGTLTAGATGAGFTVALTTSTVTGTLPVANLSDLSGLSASHYVLALNNDDDYIAGYIDGNKKIDMRSALGQLDIVPQGRLTLTAGTPVTTSDVTGATKVYYTPHVGDVAHLWDGSNTRVAVQFREFAVALGTLTSGKPYDVFLSYGTETISSVNATTDIVTLNGAIDWTTGALVRVGSASGGLSTSTVYWWNAASTTTGSLHTTLADALAGTNKVDLTGVGSPRLHALFMALTAWTNDSTRATAVVQQDGLWSKSGDERYVLLGSFYTTATTTTEDSLTKRYLSNAYNQVPRRLHYCPGYSDDNAATSYNVTATSYGEVNGGDARVSLMLTLPQMTDCNATVSYNAPAAAGMNVGIGADSVTDAYTSTNAVAAATPRGIPHMGSVSAVGKHYFAILGRVASGTGTILADAARNGSAADPRSTYLEGLVNG